MPFGNWYMLIGLSAVAVPILIHLLNRRRAKVTDWGAMRFLMEAVASQNRRIMIEEVLLLVLRCLWVALLVLAMARLMLPGRASVPWLVVLPVFLASVVCLAAATAMWSVRRLRMALYGAAAVLLLGALSAAAWESQVQGSAWSAPEGQKDVAIVIDSSVSMTFEGGRGTTSFDTAIEEARAIVDSCQAGDAVSLFGAGPTPHAVIASPTTDHDHVREALATLKAGSGSMEVAESLAAAAGAVSDGKNPSRWIILITDGQNVGWDLRNEGRWRFLSSVLADSRSPNAMNRVWSLSPSPPRIICRTLDLPEKFANLAVEKITPSRRVVGTDRGLTIDVTVANTGSEPLEPARVELEIDGLGLEPAECGQVLAQSSETVSFEHRFGRPGRHVVTARVVCADAIAADNEARHVVNVIDRLPVLVVDGAPSPGSLRGAADFIEVALAPKAADRPRAADDEESPQHVIAPTVIAAADINRVGDLDEFAVVVLANVPSLPKAFADGLGDFVREGGGLLIAPGDKAIAGAYERWRGSAGESICPAKLHERLTFGREPARLAVGTFTHPALQKAASPRRAGPALIHACWNLQADTNDPAVRVGGLFEDGRAFLVERKVGAGSVLLTALAMDARDSNLPNLECFPYLLHEMVHYLASPTMPETNVAAGDEAVMELAPVSTAGEDIDRAELGRVEVLTPAGLRRPVEATIEDGTLLVRIGETRIPGIYRLVLPEGLLRRYVPDGADERPALAVKPDASESRLAPLTQADFDTARRHVDILRARSFDEMTAALSGRAPAQPMWKYLLLGVLVVLLGEVLLSRWISLSRRTHAARTVRFEVEAVDIASFRARARELLETPSVEAQQVDKS